MVSDLNISGKIKIICKKLLWLINIVWIKSQANIFSIPLTEKKNGRGFWQRNGFTAQRELI